MVEETALATTNSADWYIAPVVDIHAALERYQAMKEFIDGILRKEVDYGIIPGTNKPTLLKPGAEKLATFFGLAPVFEIVEKELDWTGANHEGEPFFYFHYRCRMMRRGNLAAEGEGSASSFEKKYRYRLSEVVCPDCGKAAIKKSKFPPRNKPSEPPGWYCYSKAGGCGAEFAASDKRITEQERGQVKNPDIADIVNTLQKMAQKRAYVAAVLLAVNGSEYFTQDVEDFIDGSFVPEGAVTPNPAASKATGNPPDEPPDWPEMTTAQVAKVTPPANGKAQEQTVTAPKISLDMAIDHLVTMTQLTRPRVKSTLAYCDLIPEQSTLKKYECWWEAYKIARGAEKTPQESGEYANLMWGKEPNQEKAAEVIPAVRQEA